MGYAQAPERAQSRTYSLTEVLDLWNAQKAPPLYFAMGDLLVRAEYAPVSEQLFVYAVTDPKTARPLQALSAQHELVKGRKLADNFDADLIIVSCGRTFGDDECDQFSPIKVVPRTGDPKSSNKIGPADKHEYSKYLNAIGALLTARVAPRTSSR